MKNGTEEGDAKRRQSWLYTGATHTGRTGPALLLFVCALALRLPGADSARYDANADETAILRNVCTMQAMGTMDPLSFHYPSLHTYALYPVMALVRQVT